MTFRFKEPGLEGMRAMGRGDPKFDDRMLASLDGGLKLRDDDDDPVRGSRAPPFRGRRLSPGREKAFGDRAREFFTREEMLRERERSPLRGGFDDRFLERDRFRKEELPYPRRDELGRKDVPRPFLDDPYRDKGLGGMDIRGRYDSPAGFGSRFDHADDFKNRPFNYPGVPFRGYSKGDMMRPNECEIIVVNKHQRAYAEDIEARMKNLGIQVDILFLKDEALLVQTIDDIARRGSLYAIVISPLNETHGSVTLNILYGTPQEHRNMPLDDALKLVARNFHDHVRGQRDIMERDRMERGVYSGSFPADREIQFLLRMLADGRQLLIGEMETVIKFLMEQRDRMKGAAGDHGSGPSSTSLSQERSGADLAKPKDDLDIAKKEQDLQNRIMNIMNQGPPSTNVADISGNKPGISLGMSALGEDTQRSRADQSEFASSVAGGGQVRPPMGQNQQSMAANRGMGPDAARIGQSQLGATGGLDDSRGGLGPNRSGVVSDAQGANLNRGMGPPRGVAHDGSAVGSNRGGGMGLDAHGMGPNRGMGSDAHGMGQNRGIGPDSRSLGPNRGIGPNAPGIGPNRGMGSDTSGISQNRGMGPDASGMGQNRGMGPDRGPITQNRGGMAPNQQGMGANRTPLGQGQRAIGGMRDMPDNKTNPNQNVGDSGSANSAAYINLDNPSVKQALDNLMQSGPNLLKSISMTATNTSSQDMITTTNNNKAPGMTPQKGPNNNMGEGANMGFGPRGSMSSHGTAAPSGGHMGPPPRGGNMPHMQSGGMGNPQARNVSPQQLGNMNQPPPGMGPRQGQNMGPGPMSNMGAPRPGLPYQGQQSMYSSGPNSMGNRPYMGGPMGNQGLGAGGMRRY